MSVSQEDIYISVDIETDGPIPGPNSMLSLGAAALTESRGLVDVFSVNLETLPEASPDPDTDAWWKTQPEAWEACRKDLASPQDGMHRFVSWVGKFRQQGYSGPVFVAYPAGFDFLFAYWYMIRFVGESPFSFSAVDMKTYAMAMLKQPYRKCTKKAFPKRWLEPRRPHTHVAVEDALEQGLIFINMLRENIAG